MLIGLLAALGAAVLFGFSAVLQAIAVRRSGMVSKLMVLVGAGYLLGWLMHLIAIDRLPLYLAQMAIGASLAVTALVASRMVHEPLQRRHWAAIAIMVAGFTLLIAAAGPAGDADDHGDLTTVLYACIAAIAVAGVLVAQWRRRRSGILLGCLAGLAYAGAPIATRALDDPALDLRTAVPATAIVLFGLIGFVLQSLALQRVSVTAAIAPMVLLETFVPAPVGVQIFHDGVRQGWGSVVVVGFLVATAGALVLSGAEERLDHVEEVHVAHEPA